LWSFLIWILLLGAARCSFVKFSYLNSVCKLWATILFKVVTERCLHAERWNVTVTPQLSAGKQHHSSKFNDIVVHIYLVTTQRDGFHKDQQLHTPHFLRRLYICASSEFLGAVWVTIPFCCLKVSLQLALRLPIIAASYSRMAEFFYTFV